MDAFLIALGSLILYWIAYHTYGRWLARKLFRLDNAQPTPSQVLRDDQDYVPTDRFVVFGHHFASIAGTGPIVGPAIAVIWGWLPALVWVLFGSIFMGAVHDFGALVVSLRNRGQTIGEVTGHLLSKRARLLFLFILLLALTIVLAIFGLVIAVIFKLYPAAIFPCLVQIPLAIVIGRYLHRRSIKLFFPSLIALALLYLSVGFGNIGWLAEFNATLQSWPVIVWVLVLLAYSYVASVLPVWLLLQPRDYINSLQLLTSLALIILGLIAATFWGGEPVSADAARPSLGIVAPVFDFDVAGAPLVFPFLFITIACGAISGFHCLVASGTSSKQICCEKDAQFVGYGSMLTEGFLATLVILACTAGLGLGIVSSEGQILTGEAAWEARYASWHTAQGLGAKVGAFVDGAANFLKALGISQGFAVALMGVFVASFAATTLDSTCRLQRYVIQELVGSFVKSPVGQSKKVLSSFFPFGWLRNKHGATILAVLLGFTMAGLPAPGAEWSWASAGQGGLILWPLFGATNQLLGGLAFLVITFWLLQRNLPLWFVLFPTAFMLIMPSWAMLYQLFGQGVGQESSWLGADSPNFALIFIAIATIALEIWMVVEAIIAWPKARGWLQHNKEINQ